MINNWECNTRQILRRAFLGQGTLARSILMGLPNPRPSNYFTRSSEYVWKWKNRVSKCFFLFLFFFYLIRGAGWEGRMVRSCQIAIFSSHALDSDVVRSTVGRRPNLNLKMLSIFRWPSMGLLPSPNDASSSLQLLSSLSLLLLLANSLALVYA